MEFRSGVIDRGSDLEFLRPSQVLARVCAETSDPWGGRIGSMGTQATDGYEVLQSIVGGLPRESGWLNLVWR